MLGLARRSEFASEAVRVPHARGRLWVRVDLPNREDFVRFVEGGGVLDVDPKTRVVTTNRRHRVHMLSLPFHPGEVVLKVSWDNPAYPRWRRWMQRLSDPAAAAFFGALRLRRAGVPTLEPLACWSWRSDDGEPFSGLLYEKLEAVGSLADLRAKGWEEEELAPLFERAARLSARVYGAGLRHRDLSLPNFLVAESTAGPPGAAGPDSELRLIDTDQVVGRWPLPPGTSQWRQLSALRRMRLTAPEAERFLRIYLGDRYAPVWNRVLHYQKSDFHPPWRWLRRALKRRGLW